MPWNTILILSLLLWSPEALRAPQMKQAGQQKATEAPSLPQELSESESQSILREGGVKPRVEAAIRVSDAHMASALRSIETSQFKAATLDVDLYASLLIYADAVARRLPESQVKERNACLKKLEQAIFKQNRAVETVMRELPVDYRDAVNDKIAQVKKIRLHAINDVLGGGKVMNPSNE